MTSQKQHNSELPTTDELALRQRRDELRAVRDEAVTGSTEHTLAAEQVLALTRQLLDIEAKAAGHPEPTDAGTGGPTGWVGGGIGDGPPTWSEPPERQMPEAPELPLGSEAREKQHQDDVNAALGKLDSEVREDQRQAQREQLDKSDYFVGHEPRGGGIGDGL